MHLVTQKQANKISENHNKHSQKWINIQNKFNHKESPNQLQVPKDTTDIWHSNKCIILLNL